MRCRWSLKALLALAVFGLAVGGGRWSWAQVRNADVPGEFKVLPVGWDSVESACDAGEADGGAAAACDGCGCGPLWTIRAGAVILRRERPGSFPAITDPNNAVLLDAGDYDFGSAGGVDFNAMRQLGECHALEVRYFGIDGWTANQTGALVPNSQFNAAAPIPLANFSTYDSAYGSELFSTEVNLRRQAYSHLQWLAGFRYLEVNEDLSTLVDGAQGTLLYNVNTDNRLYGFQVGADAKLWECDRWSINSLLKAGVYGNSARHRGAVDFPPGVTVLGPINETRSQTAFVGEIGLTGRYRLNDCWALVGGYQLLWVDGVALASDQVPVSDFNANLGIHTGNTVFYHGALVSLERTW